MVRTNFAPQCLHRILLLVAGCIEPPLNRRETKLNWSAADGMMPFFGWLRQIQSEPTDVLQCKSAVYGLNGHRRMFRTGGAIG